MKNKMSHGKKRWKRVSRSVGGFTLMELLITMVVAGILLALAGPSFIRMIQARDLESEVSRWMGMINYARTEAIKRNQQVSLCRRPASSGCVNGQNCSCTSTPLSDWEPGFVVYVDKGDSGHYQGSSDDDILLKLGEAAVSNVEIRGNGSANRRFSILPTGALHPRDFDAAAGGARHRFCYKGESTNELPGFEVVINITGRPSSSRMDPGDSCAGS